MDQQFKEQKKLAMSHNLQVIIFWCPHIFIPFYPHIYPYTLKSPQVPSANRPLSPVPSQEVQGPRLHRQDLQHHPHLHHHLHHQTIIGVIKFFDIYRQERKNVTL